jgi:hypothetical protein
MSEQEGRTEPEIEETRANDVFEGVMVSLDEPTVWLDGRGACGLPWPGVLSIHVFLDEW